MEEFLVGVLGGIRGLGLTYVMDLQVGLANRQ